MKTKQQHDESINNPYYVIGYIQGILTDHPLCEKRTPSQKVKEIKELLEQWEAAHNK